MKLFRHERFNFNLTIFKVYILLLASRMAKATSEMAFCATSKVGSTMIVGMLNFTSTSNLQK